VVLGAIVLEFNVQAVFYAHFHLDAVVDLRLKKKAEKSKISDFFLFFFEKNSK
jgi:hypothetical protein